MKKFTLGILLFFTLAGQAQKNTNDIHNLSFSGRVDGTNSCYIGGINFGNLFNYHLVFTDGNVDANWQGATKGFIGDVAVNGIIASERTSGNVPYAGTVYTNDVTLGAWQSIIDQNVGQASESLNQTSLINGLASDLENAFSQINALPASPAYTSVSSTSLDGLNTQNGIAETFVINVTSGFQVSSQINITGDAKDVFILRWDNDANFSNGYNGQVKFQSGGAIVPHGGLTPANFINVAGDINSSGGGSTPPSPYPQGPRTNNGTGALINGGSDFNGGGFFTGYWLTTGAPSIMTAGQQPYGETSSLSNGVFVGGWYSKTTKFSMTSGTSGVYVSNSLCSAPPDLTPRINLNPNNIIGQSNIEVTVQVNELKNNPTNGSTITMFVDKQSLFSNFTFNSGQTINAAGQPVQNSLFTIDAVSNPDFYVITTNAVFANSLRRVTFSVTAKPGQTKGSTPVNVFLQNGSGGEINFANNSDFTILTFSF